MDEDLRIDSLEAAVAKIHEVKIEHREILEKVALDPGMDPQTRWELIAHLYDEEDEHVELIQSFLQQRKTPPQSSSAPSRPGLTVGSLRQERPENLARVLTQPITPPPQQGV